MFYFWGLSYILDRYIFPLADLFFWGVSQTRVVLDPDKDGSTIKPRYNVRFEILTMLVIQIFQDITPCHW
jgi:hypothetical protein